MTTPDLKRLADAKLEPCPWCQHAKFVHVTRVAMMSGNNKRRVTCDACHADGPIANTEAEAIAAWNRRAPGYAAGVEAAAIRCDKYAAALKQDADTAQNDPVDMSVENRAAIVKDFLARASAVRIAAHYIRALLPPQQQGEQSSGIWRYVTTATDGKKIVIEFENFQNFILVGDYDPAVHGELPEGSPADAKWCPIERSSGE